MIELVIYLIATSGYLLVVHALVLLRERRRIQRKESENMQTFTLGPFRLELRLDEDALEHIAKENK